MILSNAEYSNPPPIRKPKGDGENHPLIFELKEGLMPYRPTEKDKEWARSVLSKIRNHGILTYRDTGLSFIVDKNKKTLTLTHNDSLLYLGLTQQFIRSYYVFQAIGYEVLLPYSN